MSLLLHFSSSSLLVVCKGGGRWPASLGLCNPTWETQRKLLSLPSDQFSPRHCSHWGMNQQTEDLSLSFPLSANLPFPRKISKILKKNPQKVISSRRIIIHKHTQRQNRTKENANYIIIEKQDFLETQESHLNIYLFLGNG